MCVGRTRQHPSSDRNIWKREKSNSPIGMIYDKGSLGEVVSGVSMAAGSKLAELTESGAAATDEEVEALAVDFDRCGLVCWAVKSSCYGIVEGRL